jgi:hypothetical protein
MYCRRSRLTVYVTILLLTRVIGGFTPLTNCNKHRHTHDTCSYLSLATPMMTDNIDSIISPEQKAVWKKVKDTSPLAQLHRRFWLQGEYKDKLLGVHKGVHKDRAEEGEDDDDDDGDDDIGPECHILDIGIPDLEVTKFWVRKEYFRMYKQCDHHLETMRNAMKSPSQIIIGQPGIGKFFTF